MKFLLLFVLSLYALSSLAQARKHALFASYNTPGGIEGRVQILNFLKGRFELSLVTDRFEEEKNRIEPSAEAFLAEFNRLSERKDLDELLILTDLHGNPRLPGELSHSLLLSDRALSLDEMIPGLKKLKANHVKVAWMDFSCYSGATLALAKYGACIASSGNASFATQPQFVAQFGEELRVGSTFEEVFLRTRKKHYHHQLPWISTQAGIKMSKMEEPFSELFKLTNATLNLLPTISENLKKFEWTQEEAHALDLALQKGQTIVAGFGMASMAWDMARWSDVVRQERKLYERLYLAEPSELGPCQEVGF